ncbi:MFS transporter [Pleomassaria siparia CBS 279.74]|uniref:MFS transporter n=1 Tax=Pleomassaria siparia CBS 279.74 TaxID=1314801 RepID=A0A6G1KC06_9PLEO|nr:MFS transporter [Pleomassaria siparia CBS 279.74]
MNHEKGDVEHHELSEPVTLDEVKQVTTVDTVHQDEALKILGRYAGEQTWTSEEEKRLVKKIDRRLVSMLCITYGLQYYDKAMLSQAALFGLRTDLHLSVGNRYSFSASIFYLGFIVGSYPAVLMAQRWPIERVAAGIVCVWGVCLMLSSACHNWQGFYAQRFFLGFLESGVSPMFMLVVGGWYKKPEQALRMGAWYCCTGYVSAVSPLINYGLGHIKGSLSSWRYMYIVAGAITVVWAVAIYLCLPPDPIRAKGFDDRERYIAVARMRGNNSGVRNTHFKKEQLWESLLDIKFWIIFATAFLIMIANGPVSSFIPIIISGFGFNPLNSLLLTMPGGVIIGSIELGVPYLAYRIPRIRTWLIAICQLGTITASVLLWRLDRANKGGLLFACYVLASFGGGYAVLMGLQIANTAGYTKRSVTSSGIFVGYCLGNFVGPLLFKPADAPVYAPGFVAVLITSIVAALLIIVYRYVCIWENRKRDRSGTMEGFEHAYEDDLTDKTNPQFRYTL